MAQQFLSGMCFEAQDTLFAQSAGANDPTILTSPTHPIPEGTYIARYVWKELSATFLKSAPTNNWLTFSFYINFTEVSPASPFIFFIAEDGNRAAMVTMEMTTTAGRILWRDANGTEINHADSFVADTWYLISIKFKPENASTQVMVVIDKKVHSVAGAKDTDPGGSTGLFGATLNNPLSNDVAFYSAGLVIIEDDSSGIQDDEEAYNRDFVSFWYDSDESSSTPDNGSSLNSGSWNNMQEAGVNDANTGTYAVGSPASSGIISSDDGPTRSGPKGDSAVQDWDILGAIWGIRAKKQSGFDFLGQSCILKYGGHVLAGTDGTLNLAAVTITTTYKQWQVARSFQNPEVPTLIEYAQVGFQVGLPFAAKSVIVSELRCYVFFQIRRTVIDHQIVRPVRHRADPAPF